MKRKRRERQKAGRADRGADWLSSALTQSAPVRPGPPPPKHHPPEMETDWDLQGVSILKRAHLGESELMGPARGRGLFTYLSGACSVSGPICLGIWGYLLGPSSSKCPGLTTNLKLYVIYMCERGRGRHAADHPHRARPLHQSRRDSRLSFC